MSSCYHVDMKTITLSDAAYERLLEWKHHPKETFSQVVLSVVPKRGTAADLLNIMGQMPPLSNAAHQKMIEAYDDHRNPTNYEGIEDTWKQSPTHLSS